MFDDRFREGIRDLAVGAEILVLTWLDRARRDVLSTHPRNDPALPEWGLQRPIARPAEPIGLHRVSIVSIEGSRIGVRDLEALDGTPIIDVKPVLDRTER